MASARSNEVLEPLEKRTRTKTSRYTSSDFVDGKGLSPQADSVGNKKKYGGRQNRFEGSQLSRSQPDISVPQPNIHNRGNSDISDDSSDDEDSSDDKSEEEENEIISNKDRIDFLQTNMVIVIRFLMQEL